MIERLWRRGQVPRVEPPPPTNPVLTELGRQADADALQWHTVGNFKPGYRVRTANGFVAVYGRHGQPKGPLVEIQDTQGRMVWEVEGTLEERQALFSKAMASWHRQLAARAQEIRAQVERDVLGG